MRPGSVIVDMAAANGGNVEGTVAGEAVVTDNGVTIIGYTDLVGRLPAQASQLYGTNLVNLMKLMTPAKDGRLVLDWDDVVQRSMTVVRYHDGAGELTWPPPPVQVSAAPAAPAEAAAKPVESPVKHKMTSPAAAGRGRGGGRAAVPAGRAVAAGVAGPPDGVRVGDRDRLLRDRARAPRAAHTVDVGDERDLRDHRDRRPAPDRP